MVLKPFTKFGSKIGTVFDSEPAKGVLVPAMGFNYWFHFGFEVQLWLLCKFEAVAVSIQDPIIFWNRNLVMVSAQITYWNQNYV